MAETRCLNLKTTYKMLAAKEKNSGRLVQLQIVHASIVQRWDIKIYIFTKTCGMRYECLNNCNGAIYRSLRQRCP